jgi:Protein of unknown function (DUF2911)
MTSHLPPRVRLSALLLVVGALVAACGIPDGSSRKSQPAVVRQRMGSTLISVVYNRPAARGRVLFGGIVPYGQVWCPGADEATRLELSRGVRINGQPLAAGKYSVWAIPQPGEWTVIFSTKARAYHTPYPAGHDALRIRVPTQTGPYMESLGYYFPLATTDSVVLVAQWGTTVVPLHIRPE